MIRGKQGIDDVHVFFSCNSQNQPFKYLSQVPVAGNGISGSTDIVKVPHGYVGCLYEIITDPINIVTVIHICQFIDFRNIFSPQGIYHICPFIFCLAGNIIDQAAGKE